MKIIKTKKGKLKLSELREVVLTLKSGGVIIYPTETAYGLGADVFNKKAIAKIYKIKGRNFKKPLPVIAANYAQVKKIAYLNAAEQKLSQKYWPGPLALILKKIKSLPFLVTAGKSKVAVRISSSAVVRAIAAALGNPIIGTSANKAGKKECYNVKEALRQLRLEKKEIDLAIDSGTLPKTAPSTIVEIINDKIVIIRKGPITII